MTEHTNNMQRPTRTSRRRLGFALFGAIGAWFAQVLLSQALASYLCYPQQKPLESPLWNHLGAGLVIISALCLIAGFLSVITALRCWRQAGNGNSGRFLAVLGIITSVMFFSAIVFTACAALLVAPCKPWLG